MTSAKVQKLDVKSDSEESDDIAQSTSTPLQQDWQLGKSLGPCLLTLFDQQLWTDVCFTFLEDGKSTEIKAHRIILASRSPVFEAMFYGSLADTSEKIEINGISSEAFRDVIRFVYSDELNVDVHQFLCVLSGAHRYRIVTLMKYCGRCLMTKITIENVLDILECALFLEQWELVNGCTICIDKNAENILKLRQFFNVSQRVLKFILEGNTFHIPEKDILDNVTQWAENECSRKDLHESTTNMRTVLGDVFGLIRLLVFDFATIESVCSRNKLIFDEEKDDISRFLMKGVHCQRIMLSNSRVAKYDIFALDMSDNLTNFENDTSFEETFVIKPNHIIILDGLELQCISNIINYRSYSNEKKRDISKKLVCYSISLSMENFQFQKRFTKLVCDKVIEVKLDNKLLLFSGHSYEFKLELRCLVYEHCIKVSQIPRSLQTDALSLSTDGFQLLKLMKIQNLSGRHKVNDWELKGCVDLLEGRKDATLVAAINNS